jgi:hypothetical protein
MPSELALIPEQAMLILYATFDRVEDYTREAAARQPDEVLDADRGLRPHVGADS